MCSEMSLKVQDPKINSIIEKEFELEKDIFEMFGKIMHIAEPTPPPNGITLTPEVIERLKSALY